VGYLNGSKWHRQGDVQQKQMIKLVECKNVTIEGITIVDGPNLGMLYPLPVRMSLSKILM